MGHDDGTVVRGRNRVVRTVRLVNLVPVLENYVVRIDEIRFQPFVEVILDIVVHRDDTVLAEGFILPAGRERYGEQGGNQCKNYIFFHIRSSMI